MTPQSEPRCFRARMSALPQLIDCVRAACRDAGLVPPSTLRVELALEELFTNTVRHGYGGECDRPVWIEAAEAPGGLRLVYQDAAAPFDPVAAYRTGGTPARADRLGGQGIPLICSLASRVAYARSGERNVLTLSFQAAA